MKKLLILLSLLIVYNFSTAQYSKYGYTFQYNESENKIFYEEILNFENKSGDELMEKVKKFLALYGAIIRWEDENEIYATGKVETRLKKKFLIFFNHTEYYALYDIKISIKENKIRYNTTNFYLVPKSININSMSWFGSQTKYGSAAWSTTKIPTDVPKRPIEIHLKRKIKPKNKLFPDIEADMNDFVKKLTATIKEKEDNW